MEIERREAEERALRLKQEEEERRRLQEIAMLKKQKEEEERRRQEEAERRRKEQEELKKVGWALNPVSPQYLHTNSPNWSSYISIKNKLREFDKRSKHFLLGDHFANSHNLFSWLFIDIVRRILMLVTLET